MGYCSLQNIRDEGITESQAGDARVTMLIALAGQYIEKITRRWFEPRTLTLRLDGRDSDTVFLPAPIISVSSVIVEGDTAPDDLLTIYNRSVPDDRHCPRITYRNRFVPGYQNIEVAGKFGYTDPDPAGTNLDGVTPELIKRAAIMLVMRELPQLKDLEAQEDKKRARIITETTDGHSYTLAHLAVSGEWTGSPEIDGILYFYKATAVGTV